MHRRAISHDMRKAEHQNVLLGLQAKKLSAQQRRPLEIEWLGEQTTRHVLDVLLRLHRGLAGQIGKGQIEAANRPDTLRGRPARNGAAQYRMVGNQATQYPLQQRGLQLSLNLNTALVIRRIPKCGGNKPEAVLGITQRIDDALLRCGACPFVAIRVACMLNVMMNTHLASSTAG